MLRAGTDAPKKKRRKKGRKGKPNALQIDITPTDGAEWGPAMNALRTDRHRAFVLALYQVKPGYGAHVKAAKLAGFGTSTSSAQSWSVIAAQLAGDDKIQAALFEEDQRRLRATAPRAITALGRLVENVNHKDHARAIAMTLDRVHPAETRHIVDVNHSDTRGEHLGPDALAKMLTEFSLTFGLDPAKVLTGPPIIDAEFVEVAPLAVPRDE